MQRLLFGQALGGRFVVGDELQVGRAGMDDACLFVLGEHQLRQGCLVLRHNLFEDGYHLLDGSERAAVLRLLEQGQMGRFGGTLRTVDDGLNGRLGGHILNLLLLEQAPNLFLKGLVRPGLEDLTEYIQSRRGVGHQQFHEIALGDHRNLGELLLVDAEDLDDLLIHIARFADGRCVVIERETGLAGLVGQSSAA